MGKKTKAREFSFKWFSFSMTNLSFLYLVFNPSLGLFVKTNRGRISLYAFGL